MGFLLIAIAAMVLVGLAGIAVVIGMMRYFSQGHADDDRLSFDPLAAPAPYPRRIFTFMTRWLRRPLQLTYRRDRRGRFRKKQDDR